MHKYLLLALLFVFGIAFTGTAHAATLTVCDDGCDHSTIDAAFAAANEGDVIDVQGGGSGYDASGEDFGVSGITFPHASITLQCTGGASIGQSDPAGVNTLFLSTTSTITGCLFENINLSTPESVYTSGIRIVNNSFTQGATGTIDFLDGHVAYAEISGNANIRWLRSTASSTNMLISGNTFYGDKPIDEADTRGTILGLVGTSTMPIIQNNTFLMGYDASETVAHNSSFLYVYADGMTFTTNTVRVTSLASPANLKMTLDIRTVGGVFSLSGNTLTSPLDSGSCQTVNIQPALGLSMTPSFTFTNNTLRTRCGRTGDIVKVHSAGIGAETMTATLLFTRNLFLGDDSSGSVLTLNGLSAPSSAGVTFVKNGRYGVEQAMEGVGNTVISDTWKTNNPLLRVADVDSTNDSQVVPFSDYLDIDGTTDDIGAWLGTRRSTIYLDDNGTVDYATIDVNPGDLSKTLQDGLRSGDTIQMAAGTYDSIFISSERATTTVSLIGAGPSTIIDPSGSSEALYISGITNATVSDLTIQGADDVLETVTLRHMLFSYGGNDYDDGMSSANAGGSPFPPEWGIPAPMLIIQDNACSWIYGTSWEANLTGILGTPPLNVHVVLGTTNGGTEYGTFVVPKEAFADQAAFATGCPAVSVDAFIEDVFVYNPATGDYAYDESAITSAGATLMAGLASAPDLDRQLSYYAGLSVAANVTSSTFSNLVISGNGYGVYFAADAGGGGGGGGGAPSIAHGNSIRNSVFTENSQYDVKTDSSGQNILDNTSFTRTSANVTDVAGSLLVKYDARVRTLRGSDSSTAVDGVAITFTDDASAETSGGSTSSGYTGYVSLPAHTITNSANTLTTGGYNAYTISSAAVSGFAVSSTSATLSERNQTIALYLSSDTAAPGAPTVTALSGTTASITIDANGNGGTTEYAVYNSTASTYVAADGSASGSPAWQTAATWGATTISGLTCATAYNFETIARSAVGELTATSTAGTVTTSACPVVSSGGGGGGGGGGGSSGGGGAIGGGGGGGSIVNFFNAPTITPPPVSPVVPVLPPAPPVSPVAEVPLTEVAQPVVAPPVVPAVTVDAFIESGSSAASRALGSGERGAVVRDAIETMGREAGAIPVDDLERIANGEIPRTRNLSYEQSMVPRALATFRTIFGRTPNFQNPIDNLAWNTMMYRIRFPRNLTEERQGIVEFRRLFRIVPQSPFQWSVVRVLGYVR